METWPASLGQSDDSNIPRSTFGFRLVSRQNSRTWISHAHAKVMIWLVISSQPQIQFSQRCKLSVLRLLLGANPLVRVCFVLPWLAFSILYIVPIHTSCLIVAKTVKERVKLTSLKIYGNVSFAFQTGSLN